MLPSRGGSADGPGGAMWGRASVVVAAALTMAAPAQAGTVDFGNSHPRLDEVRFTALTGERNDVTIVVRSVPGLMQTADVTDPGGPLVPARVPPPSQCTYTVFRVACRSDLPIWALITLGDGDDRVRVVTQGATTGSSISGGAGGDRLIGGDGTDTLYGESGADDLRGGGGGDLAFYGGDLLSEDIRVSLDDVADDGVAGEGDNVHSDVEDVWAGHGNDVLIGSSGANSLDGSAGDDRLVGGSGGDALYGDAGDDVIDARDGIPDAGIHCGPGSDTVYADLLDPVDEDCEIVDRG
jgi:hypothetical protein